jgi:hypothetical protein
VAGDRRRRLAGLCGEVDSRRLQLQLDLSEHLHVAVGVRRAEGDVASGWFVKTGGLFTIVI